MNEHSKKFCAFEHERYGHIFNGYCMRPNSPATKLRADIGEIRVVGTDFKVLQEFLLKHGTRYYPKGLLGNDWIGDINILWFYEAVNAESGYRKELDRKVISALGDERKTLAEISKELELQTRATWDCMREALRINIIVKEHDTIKGTVYRVNYEFLKAVLEYHNSHAERFVKIMEAALKDDMEKRKIGSLQGLAIKSNIIRDKYENAERITMHVKTNTRKHKRKLELKIAFFANPILVNLDEGGIPLEKLE
ncbi:MAG: hypothetical protein ABIG20_03130 [archaeon]